MTTNVTGGGGRDAVVAARRLAEDVLFPAASAVDASPAVPRSHLDALAGAGLYGLMGPVTAGGLEADFSTLCEVVEALASGCLTTTFVWSQHIGTVNAVASNRDLAERWLPSLCSGEVRSGVALGATVRDPPLVVATRVEGGWTLSGVAPWVSGWGLVDVVHTAARDADDNAVWTLVDARETGALTVEPLQLLAVDASATVRARFIDLFVPEDRVTGVVPPEEWRGLRPAALRIHAALVLGVARRCCALMGPSSFDAEVDAAREALDEASPEAMPEARAAASEVALRASAAYLATAGARGVAMDHHAQRLAREAMFLSVFGSRPPVRAALLDQLGYRGRLAQRS